MDFSHLQNIIGGFQTLIAWAIPDVSSKLVKRIKRENFLLREFIIEYEKYSAVKEHLSDDDYSQTDDSEAEHDDDDCDMRRVAGSNTRNSVCVTVL